MTYLAVTGGIVIVVIIDNNVNFLSDICEDVLKEAPNKAT